LAVPALGAATPDVADVTVVIPVWDDYVAVIIDAVQSVGTHDGGPRILVVDNASRSPLPALPDRVAVRRLRQRASAGAARNAGLAAVRTRYVLFLDADDCLVAGTLARLRDALDNDPRLVGCCSSVVAWDPGTGDTVPLAFPSKFVRRIGRWPRVLALAGLLRNRIPTTGCLLMRTSDARAAGGFADGDLAEDWCLNVALAFRGRIAFLPDVGRLLRVHASSLRSQPHTRQEVVDAFRMVRRLCWADPRAPLAARVALPIIAAYHRRKVTRMTPAGTLAPRTVRGLAGAGQLASAPAAATALERWAAP
jgi:hypothetical protein